MLQAQFTPVSSYTSIEICQRIVSETIQLERKSDLGSPGCLPCLR